MGTVNYRRNPEWQEEVLELTGGAGVMHVLEIGGRDTLPRALQVLDYGAHVALIGGLTGFGGGPLLRPLQQECVGHRLPGRLARGLRGHEPVSGRLRDPPVVDRVFEFEDAVEAFDFYMNGDFMGKVVIRH